MSDWHAEHADYEMAHYGCFVGAAQKAGLDFVSRCVTVTKEKKVCDHLGTTDTNHTAM